MPSPACIYCQQKTDPLFHFLQFLTKLLLPALRNASPKGTELISAYSGPVEGPWKPSPLPPNYLPPLVLHCPESYLNNFQVWELPATHIFPGRGSQSLAPHVISLGYLHLGCPPVWRASITQRKYCGGGKNEEGTVLPADPPSYLGTLINKWVSSKLSSGRAETPHPRSLLPTLKLSCKWGRNISSLQKKKKKLLPAHLSPGTPGSGIHFYHPWGTIICPWCLSPEPPKKKWMLRGPVILETSWEPPQAVFREISIKAQIYGPWTSQSSAVPPPQPWLAWLQAHKQTTALSPPPPHLDQTPVPREPKDPRTEPTGSQPPDERIPAQKITFPTQQFAELPWIKCETLSR